MIDISTEPIHFNLYYGGKSVVETLEDNDAEPVTEVIPPVDITTPTFRNIFIKDVTCSNARKAMYFYGLPEHNIDNINVENVVIHSQLGAEIMESKNITLKNVNIYPKEGSALILRNVSDVKVDGFTTDSKLPSVFEVSGLRSKNIVISSAYKANQLKLGSDIKSGVVKLVYKK